MGELCYSGNPTKGIERQEAVLNGLVKVEENPTKGIERYGLRLTDATFTAASEPNKGN